MRPSGLVLVADAAGEVGGALAARAKPLAGRAERHERTVGRAVAARQLAEALIDALTLTAHVLELPLGLVGDRALGRREERVSVARALGRVTASRRRVTRGRPSRAGRLLERPDGLVGAGLPGLLGLPEVVLQPPGERTRRLAAEGETLARPLEPVQRADRRLARAGGVGELDLGALTLGENGLEPLLRRPPGERGRGATLLRLRPASLEGLEVEPGDARAQRCDLEPQLLRALGSGRLERQRPEPLAHLLLDVPRPLGLSGDPGELELRPVTTALELSEAGRLLDEGTAVGRPRREHGVDLSLADDRVHRAAEPDVGEQLDEVGAAHGGAVDEVLPFAAAHEPSRDRDLAEVELVPEAAVLVVEHELDLAVVGGLAGRGAPEEDVVGLLGAHLGRRQRAGRPDDRIGDVRLAGAVRADHDGHPGLEAHLDGIRERLEAAQLDAPQVHARARLSVRPDSLAAARMPLRNAEIASRLYVTPKSVEANLSRVYRKLGIRSRTELARHLRRRLTPGAAARGRGSGHRRMNAECRQRLGRRLLLGGLLRRAAADAELLAVDERGADEPALVRRPVDVEHVVLDAAPRPRQRLLELRLRVDVTGARILDPLVEGLHDRRRDDVEAVLEVDGRDRGLQQRGEHVPAQRDAVELGPRDVLRACDEHRAEVERAGHRGAALPRDDVRPDLRETPLGRIGEAVVERPCYRELEDRVAEELETLVRGRAVRRPGRVREDLVAGVGGKGVDQARERLALPLAHLTDARRRSRRPDRRSSASGRPRPGS